MLATSGVPVAVPDPCAVTVGWDSHTEPEEFALVFDPQDARMPLEIIAKVPSVKDLGTCIFFLLGDVKVVLVGFERSDDIYHHLITDSVRRQILR